VGGLFVLGTERHDARRIDNQLRGRSGRQGDPGETQFFVSLEDSLMRVFASDMIKRVMGTFNIPEDEPIANSMITRSLEKAQTRIEEINFDARKHVLAYDDVLNVQRQSVYARRRSVLTGNDTSIEEELARLFVVYAHAREGELAEADESCKAFIEQKKREMGDAFYPRVRRIILQTIDYLWVEHLEAMEYLRSSVNLRAYGQRDPLVEYKREGLQMYQSMEIAYAEKVIEQINAMTVDGTSIATIHPPAEKESDVIHKAVLGITSAGRAVARKAYGRNDHVILTNGKEERQMKYKKAEALIATGEWRIKE
jgi:preprotein translocase subunit SecA